MKTEKSNAYDNSIGDKSNTPLARRLRDLITDTNALKDYLGCSLQAINQYKQGTAYPKIENLIKIADFYHVSVDYLLGITDIPSRDTDKQAVCEYTGLSDEAVENLSRIKEGNHFTGHSGVISSLIEAIEPYTHVLSLISAKISFAEKRKFIEENPYRNAAQGSTRVYIDEDIGLIVKKGDLIDSLLRDEFNKVLEAVPKFYLKRFSKTPAQINAEWKISLFNKPTNPEEQVDGGDDNGEPTGTPG